MVKSRARGILSEADREFLENPDDESRSDPARSKRRTAIIERTRNGILDFQILRKHLPDNLRQEIFESPASDESISAGVIDTIAVYFLGVADQFAGLSSSPIEIFEDFIEDGIKKAYFQRGESVRNVSVDITVETGPSLEELREREELGLIEILQLVEAGELSGEEARELMNELLQDRGDELVDEEGRFQGGAARFHIEDLDPIFEDLPTKDVTDEFRNEE